MTEKGFVDPARENFDAFKALPRDTPIHMLNLVRFRDRSDYPDGHPLAGKGLTGAQAYAEYGRTSGPVFARVGGTVVWRGRMEAMVIGPVDEKWDAAFIARYPDAAAFLQMVTDPEYKIAVVNRQAAVLTSRLIRFSPQDGDSGAFG
jgi:uncharacterized protein (DUF1330 family)